MTKSGHSLKEGLDFNPENTALTLEPEAGNPEERVLHSVSCTHTGRKPGTAQTVRLEMEGRVQVQNCHPAESVL